MARVALRQNLEKSRNVKNKGQIDKKMSLVFTFANFHLNSINIERKFNNFYKNDDEYIRKLSLLIGKALPLLSMETVDIFNDINKMDMLHLHKIRNRNDLLEEIFQKYSFSEDKIKNMLEGENIYQLEVPYENGSSRVVFQKVDNIISFLFMDPNHHIYFNKDMVERSGSLFYNICPICDDNLCPRMNYLQTCFAFEFLDKNKYQETYEYNNGSQE